MRTISFQAPILCAVLAAACSSPIDRSSTDDGVTGTSSAAATTTFQYKPHLTSGGGPVLANVEVVGVAWGNVSTQVTTSLEPLYAGATSSGYFDTLAEYGVGHGKLDTFATIAPTHTGAVSEDDVAAEIVGQIASGHLPPPNANTLYMVHFAPGTNPTMGGKSAGNGWCGYHWRKTVSGYVITFAVLPDFTPGSACGLAGASASWVSNMTSAASHELTEAVTDPSGGSGWIDRDSTSDLNGAEIGDLCNNDQTPIVVGGTTTVVQRVWSNGANACVTANPESFTRVPGCATAIGSGGPVPWILGCTKFATGYQPYRWNGYGWDAVSGAATAIAVSPEGNPWVVNSSGTIYKWNASTSRFDAIGAQACAKEIAVGANDDAWIIDCVNGEIFELTGGPATGSWKYRNGSAVRISAQPYGAPWVVNSAGQVYAYQTDTATFIPPGSNNNPTLFPSGVLGCGTDIAVTRGEYYLIGCTNNGVGGNGVYQYRSAFPGWDQIPGAATSIAITLDGTPWVVNANGNIYRFNSNR